MADRHSAQRDAARRAGTPRPAAARRRAPWRRGDRGATIIEYALAVSLVGTVAMGSVQAVTSGGEDAMGRAVNDVEGEQSVASGSGEIVEPAPTSTTTTPPPPPPPPPPPAPSTFTATVVNQSTWQNGPWWQPRAQFTVRDNYGQPLPNVTLFVRFGTNTTTYWCTTNSSGVCSVAGANIHSNNTGTAVTMHGVGVTGTTLTYTGSTSHTLSPS